MKLQLGINVSKGSNCVKLLKALYGLKQSPMEWNVLDKSLKELNFIQSKADPCLYYLSSKEIFTMCGIYVDDLVLGSNC